MIPAPTMPEQRRLLRTEIPGPRSRKLQEERSAAVSRGFGIALPVFVDHAGGAVIVDVDGNQLVDLASGIAVTSIGASHPEVVRRIAGNDDLSLDSIQTRLTE